MIRHSQTSVMVRGHNVKGDYERLQQNCPSCQNRVIVSKGPHAINSRDFIDRTNKNLGSYLHGRYFDCELDIVRGRYKFKKSKVRNVPLFMVSIFRKHFEELDWDLYALQQEP